MGNQKKFLEAIFFKNISGCEPVRDFLQSLDSCDKIKIGTDIMSVEFGWPIGMPTVRSLGSGLFEVRTNLDRRISRVFFCVESGKMILLHVIIKKGQKTPSHDLRIARKRLKDRGAI